MTRARMLALAAALAATLATNPVAPAGGTDREELPLRPAGVGELALDRAAVAGLLDRWLERSYRLEVPGASWSAAVRRTGPPTVTFEDGDLRLTLPARLEPPGLDTELALRLRPGTRPLDGALLLRPVEATLPPPAPRPPASWIESLPPVRLPRTFRWTLEGPDGPVESRIAIQGVRIEERRLVLELGLALAAVPPVTRP